MSKGKQHRIIISGGGTGGHIFPAIAIAHAIAQKQPQTKILFVGALGKIEMTVVPRAGYDIHGLPVRGFTRKFTLKNLSVLFDLWRSIRKSRKIIKDFKPDVVIGVGGYASGPVSWVASRMKVPLVLQEQNSYAGLTNKILAKRAQKVCVAYENMHRFFPEDKIILTGNPIRNNLQIKNREEAYKYFDMSPNHHTVLLLGGSGGARSINQAMTAALQKLQRVDDIQFIWQTGKFYFLEAQKAVAQVPNKKVLPVAFIDDMAKAFAAADVVVSRAGAGTISELYLVGKPVILVPSPNVAEDHQTRNAGALVEKDAAIMIADNQAGLQLVDKAIELCQNQGLKQKLSENIVKMAKPHAADQIADLVLDICNKQKENE